MRGAHRRKRLMCPPSTKKHGLPKIFLLLCTTMMASCVFFATYSPVNTNRLIAGIPVVRLEIFVEEPYSYVPKWAWMTHTLPLGSYHPIFEDSKGVYFQAPNHIILTEFLFGYTFLRNGGIYLKFDAIDQPYLYIFIDSAATYKLHPDFVLNLREVPK